jgi:hypothetical protein
MKLSTLYYIYLSNLKIIQKAYIYKKTLIWVSIGYASFYLFHISKQKKVGKKILRWIHGGMLSSKLDVDIVLLDEAGRQ